MKSALQWAYTTERIPRGHWLQKGCSEEYANEMEQMLSSFKQIIQSLRVGTVSDRIIIDFDLQDEDGNYLRANHDELLLPYWEEFTAALKHWSDHYADDKYLEVLLQDIELPKVVLDILRPAFEQSRLDSVFFRESGHSRDMTDFVNKVLHANHFITDVGFGAIMFDQEDIKSICSAIKARNFGGQFIKRLELAECFEDGIESQTLTMILETVVAATSNNLVLSQNGMSSREAGIIAEFLSVNPNISSLNVSDNRFDDADAALLANALSNNANLRDLTLNDNPIKENGRLAFLRTIFDVSSLDLSASSNYTCQVYGLEQDISALNFHEQSFSNKWEKIFTMLALSSDDSFVNTSLLEGVPAQLIPVLLNEADYVADEDDNPELTDLYLELTNAKRCQKHDAWDNLGVTKSLNCVYELMRCWAVPLIFA